MTGGIAAFFFCFAIMLFVGAIACFFQGEDTDGAKAPWMIGGVLCGFGVCMSIGIGVGVL